MLLVVLSLFLPIRWSCQEPTLKGGYMDNITQILGIVDSNVIVSDSWIEGSVKYLTLETPPSVHFCPQCSFRMHSRGIKERRVSHPVLQDGYELCLVLKQRRWRCTNPACRYEANEHFQFVDRQRRKTNSSDILIVLAFRNLSESASSIAARFHTSDTHVLEVFDRYVKPPRLPLTDIISVDEVHLDLDKHCKYALVIQDFYTGDPIDLLRSRRSDVTEPYFASIPVEERKAVRYLISDMYNPYISFVDKYFPNAVPVVDSFHVIQWIVRSIDNYIRSLIRQFRQRDRELEERKSEGLGGPVSLPTSDEVYLLQKYKWLVLSNQSNITYHPDPRMDRHFRCLMNTYDYEDALFRISPRLRTLRDLKELYIQFNIRNAGNTLQAGKEIDKLIALYKRSGDSIFIEFAGLLFRFRAPIINSFVMVEKHGTGKLYESRLSNGPIESLNRKVKDLKRLGRGFRNFEHIRNRFLFAERGTAAVDTVQDHHPVIYMDDDE